jgi:uncharacterized protein (TIGR02284 family)
MEYTDAISTLNHLVAIARDGVEGMKSAADHAKNPSLKSALERLSQERDHVATDLRSAVRSLGGEAEDSGTTLGAAHRTFMNIKEAVSASDDRSLIEECERGEDKAMKEFRQALSQDLPSEVRARVQTCFQQVKQSHDEIRNMRDNEPRTIIA